MPKQPEQILEDNLIVQLQTLCYTFVTIIDEKISLCNTQIAKTEQYKKGLLKQMFV